MNLRKWAESVFPLTAAAPPPDSTSQLDGLRHAVRKAERAVIKLKQKRWKVFGAYPHVRIANLQKLARAKVTLSVAQAELSAMIAKLRGFNL